MGPPFFNFRLRGSSTFSEGRCPGSKAVTFSKTNSFVSTPIINFNSRSFTIACWIKQTRSVFNELAAIYGDWYYPWQFLLSVKNQEMIFHRHKHGVDEWWSLGSTKVALDTWTHVVVIWDHENRAVSILADGKTVGYRSFTSGGTFYQPTGRRYQIGDDGHRNDHQFYGSVMDLYVFGSALSLEQINKLRGELPVNDAIPNYLNSIQANFHFYILVNTNPDVVYCKILRPLKKKINLSHVVNDNYFRLSTNRKRHRDCVRKDCCCGVGTSLSRSLSGSQLHCVLQRSYVIDKKKKLVLCHGAQKQNELYTSSLPREAI